MKYEHSCGAVLYRNNAGIYEYLVIKDWHGNDSFPKGHMNPEEGKKQCALREVKEEVGIDMDPDPYFCYTILYPIKFGYGKFVTFYMADIGNADPYINDGEVKQISLLPYEEAYELLTFDQHKEVLKEVNDRLMNDMKICCMFQNQEDFDRMYLEHVKDYGSTCNGHDLHVFDEGDRTLYRCTLCGAYVLEQYSKSSSSDAYCISFYPVRNEEHAEEINVKYDGAALEKDYPYKGIIINNKDKE